MLISILEVGGSQVWTHDAGEIETTQFDLTTAEGREQLVDKANAEGADLDVDFLEVRELLPEGPDKALIWSESWHRLG